MKIWLKTLLMLFAVAYLTACQSHVKSSKIIASVFNVSTDIQQKFIEKRAPQNVLVTRDIPYQTQLDDQHKSLTFDLYQPENIAALAPRPTIVWIHGGGWISGSKLHGSGYFKLLANEGYNVVAVQYQFAPEHIYPTQLGQIDEALAYISKHAKDFNIDANQLFLAGDSAGANMASHYATLLTTSDYASRENFKTHIEPSQLKGLILHCGIYDMASFVATAPQEMRVLEWGVNNLVQSYTGGKKDDVAFLNRISSSQHLSAHYPPVLISGGNKDFLTKSQSYPFVKALEQYQIPVTTLFYPDSKEILFHEYQFMMSKEASQQTFAATLDFLKQRTQ
ncbi:alpha/beta hydrolase [Acinetobacter sp. NCu2D-2]|uniref:alpha/beta hydrolase n=1 Tax=Acinetobacter sp. NCu2D-2 TaxID=1608473 RepID=UPI0007CDB8BE|nr:alpha/beta hydrolase [Acinetobacter sp. NCu2D-2]ANF81951.1 alpha/beta hydrolase [Acinetobacter sp. NCu2D-2]